MFAMFLISFCYFEFQLYPDNFAKREMMTFTVACQLKKSKGCDWKGALEKLQVFQDMKCYFSIGVDTPPLLCIASHVVFI